MSNKLHLSTLTLICALAFGCAQKQNSLDKTMHGDSLRESYQAAYNKNSDQSGSLLLRNAKSAIGTPYVRGGDSPGGFDCSGFVCWTYKSVGVDIPRTAKEQSVVGQRIVRPEDMQAGDIVAFRHPKRGYHTGIYVGDGKFIHSPHRRSSVRITSLSDPYFSKIFLSARRVRVADNEILTAQAETRLNDFTEEKTVRELTAARKNPAKPKPDMASRGKTGKKPAHVAANATKNTKKSAMKSASKTGKQSSTQAAKAQKTARTSGKNKPHETTVSASSFDKQRTSSGSKKIRKKI